MKSLRNVAGFLTRWSLMSGVVSGTLVALSLPKADWYPLAWIALVPLFVVLASPMPLRRAALAGYAAGLAYYAGTCYWITGTMVTYGGLGSLAAFGVAALFCLSHAFYFALFGLAVAALCRRYGARALAVAPSLWVAMELVRGYFPLGGFPWMLSGYALVPYAGILQIATWTGVFGLSFIIAAVNASLAYMLLKNDRRFAIAPVLAVLIAWLAPAPAESSSGDAVDVRLVQPDIALNQRWQPQEYARLLDRLISLSVDSAPRAPDATHLIVWPETPAPFALADDPEFRRLAERIAVQSGGYFLLGYLDSIGEAPSNSAALLDPAGHVVSRYDKIRLVPFGEYVPMKDLLFFAGKLVEQVGDFAPGSRLTVSNIGKHRLATVICYESIFPDFSRKFVREGAELLVIITNDEWFGSSSAPFQHLRMGVMRAVENRRYVVRVANSGITAIIDPYGRVVSRAPRGEIATLDGVARFRSELTFYARYGDVFAVVNVVAALLVGVAAAVSRRA
ncbi:MAG TPA: apolipoprotein N-acyltransferase [Terriglobia bacterium]|nr:apolipoprotein N-acyltransferase [Terriglobia bacterium]